MKKTWVRAMGLILALLMIGTALLPLFLGN